MPVYPAHKETIMKGLEEVPSLQTKVEIDGICHDRFGSAVRTNGTAASI